MMYAPFYSKLCSPLSMNLPGDSLLTEGTWLNHNIILLQETHIYKLFEKKVLMHVTSIESDFDCMLHNFTPSFKDKILQHVITH